MIFKKKIIFLPLIFLLFFILLFSGCLNIIDNPEMPSRGFFMGLLPNPAEGQNIEDAYIQASEYSEFVPIWSAGTGANGFWDYAEKIYQRK